MKARKLSTHLTLQTFAGLALCLVIFSGAGQPQTWATYQKAGDEALLKGLYGDAERAFKSAIQEAEKNRVSKRKLAKSLKSLANLYAIRGRDDEAEQLFARSLNLRKAIHGQEHPDVISSQKALALKYLSSNKTDQADKISSELLKLADAKIKDHKSIKKYFDGLGQFYGQHRNFTQAELHIDTARELTRKGLADQHLELAAALDSLGQKYKSAGDLPKAEAFFQRGLYLRESALAPEHRALVHSMDNLAAVYMAQKKFKKAEPLYKRSLKIINDAPGKPNPTDLARHLEHLGSCYQGQGRRSSAEACFKKALNTVRNSYGSKHQYVGKSSYRLACLYVDQARYSEAEPLLRQALSISEKTNGPRHSSLQPILNKYATVLDRTNRAGRAHKMRDRARKIGG